MKFLLIISYNFGIIAGRSTLQSYVFDTMEEIEGYIKKLKDQPNIQITFFKVIEGEQKDVNIVETSKQKTISILK